LFDICATDSSEQVVMQVESLMLPSLSLWALHTNTFHEPLVTHLVDKIEFHLSNKNKNRKVSNKFKKKNKTKQSNTKSTNYEAINICNFTKGKRK
jgi:hypothetical protein